MILDTPELSEYCIFEVLLMRKVIDTLDVVVNIIGFFGRPHTLISPVEIKP